MAGLTPPTPFTQHTHTHTRVPAGFMAVEIGEKRMALDFIGLETPKPLYSHIIHLQ